MSRPYVDQTYEMNRQEALKKVAESIQKAKRPVLFFCGALVLGVALFQGAKNYTRHSKLFEREGAKTLYSIAYGYVSLFKSIFEKAETLAIADAENRRLRLEIANLRVWGEDIREKCSEDLLSERTRRYQTRLQADTGTLVGRSLAAIDYRPPARLLPVQLYSMGMNFFKLKDYEKSSVLLTHVVDLEESDQFRSAKNFLTTAISWYQLENYKMADHYLARVLDYNDTPSNLRYKAQARLWKALIFSRMDQPFEAQVALKDLLSYHPKSEEIKWVSGSPGSLSSLSESESRFSEPEKDSSQDEDEKVTENESPNKEFEHKPTSHAQKEDDKNREPAQVNEEGHEAHPQEHP